jgi:chemotaxis protein MotB
LAALREQLAQVQKALDIANIAIESKDVEIKDLGARLNLALADKVNELTRYRSEFFGKLRAALGNRADIQIVGDRFVVPSELLFPSASDELNPTGTQQLNQLAATLKEVTAQIPPDIDWVLRIDGHTDHRPISTGRFPSNWELSSARAIAIVKFLSNAGIAPRRLAANGFGEFHPLDSGSSEEALARNRRIEIQLTNR